MDLTSSLEAKFGARSGQVHQIRKNLGSFVTIRCKSWEKVPILGSYLKFRGQNLGYLSFIFLEAKFGASPPPLPQCPNMEVPPGDNREKNTNVCVTSAEPEFTLNHEGFKEFPWEYSHLPRKFIMPIPCFNSCFHFHLQA